MEFLLQNIQEQETSIHEKCFNRYTQLKSKYELKNREMIGYKTKANYWEAQFRQLKSREEQLISENEKLKAKLRKREQELFGKSSEKNNKTPDSNPQSSKEKSKKIAGNNQEVKVTDAVTIAIYPLQKKKLG